MLAFLSQFMDISTQINQSALLAVLWTRDGCIAFSNIPLAIMTVWITQRGWLFVRVYGT